MIPALAGLTVFGGQLFGGPLTLDRILCALAPAVLVGLLVVVFLKVWSKRAKAETCKSSACQASGSCGCKKSTV